MQIAEIKAKLVEDRVSSRLIEALVPSLSREFFLRRIEIAKTKTVSDPHHDAACIRVLQQVKAWEERECPVSDLVEILGQRYDEYFSVKVRPIAA